MDYADLQYRTFVSSTAQAQSQGKERSAVGKHIGPSHRRTELGGVQDVVLQARELRVEKPIDLVADDSGEGQSGLLQRANQAVAKTFAAMLGKLDNHQVGDQLQHGVRNGADNVFAEVEVLIPHHIERSQKLRHCIEHIH